MKVLLLIIGVDGTIKVDGTMVLFLIIGVDGTIKVDGITRVDGTMVLLLQFVAVE